MREVILGNVAGAASHPLVESNSESVCIMIGNGLTSSGIKEDEPVFKLIADPLI